MQEWQKTLNRKHRIVIGCVALLAISWIAYLVVWNVLCACMRTAVKTDNIQTASDLLRRFPTLITIPGYQEGDSLLHLAAQSKSAQVDRLLLKSGLDADAPGHRHLLPIHHAV